MRGWSRRASAVDREVIARAVAGGAPRQKFGLCRYCSSTPAFLTSFAYFAISSRKNFAANSGVLTLIVLPCLAIVSRNSGVEKAVTNAALIRFTSAADIFAGPITANQPSTR